MKIELNIEIYVDGEFNTDFQLDYLPQSSSEFDEVIAEKTNEILGTNLTFDEHELDVGVQIGVAYLSNYQYSDILYLSTVTHISEDDFDKIYAYCNFNVANTVALIKSNVFKTKNSFVDKFCEDNNITNYEKLLPYFNPNRLIGKMCTEQNLYYVILGDSVLISKSPINNFYEAAENEENLNEIEEIIKNIVSKNGIEGI